MSHCRLASGSPGAAEGPAAALADVAPAEGRSTSSRRSLGAFPMTRPRAAPCTPFLPATLVAKALSLARTTAYPSLRSIDTTVAPAAFTAATAAEPSVPWANMTREGVPGAAAEAAAGGGGGGRRRRRRREWPRRRAGPMPGRPPPASSPRRRWPRRWLQWRGVRASVSVSWTIPLLSADHAPLHDP